MTPPPAATARAVAPAPERSRSNRPSLRVVRPAPRRRGRRPWGEVLALVLIVASLLFVVAGHALLASQQVRLSGVQTKLTAEQARHRQMELGVATLENPQRITQEADALHMTNAGQATQVPSVPLTAPLPAPNLTPDPAAPAPAPTSATPGR